MQFAHPEAPFAHPLDDGTAVVVERSIDATASALGLRDGRAYARLVRPLVEQCDTLMEALLGPFSIDHPIAMAKFGRHAIRSAKGLAKHLFETERARAMFAGVAAHSMVPLDKLATSGYALGLILAAHTVGWPVSRGGAQRLADALTAYLRSLGGEMLTDSPVDSLAALPPSRVVLFDVTPRQLVRIAGDQLSRLYRWRLARYRYGPGVFKMDWALNAPVPWNAPRVPSRRYAAPRWLARGDRDRRARVVGRPSLPTGRTCWSRSRVCSIRPARREDSIHCGRTATCRTARQSICASVLERQIERFARGFRDCIEEAHVMAPADLERSNANLVGGDTAVAARRTSRSSTRGRSPASIHTGPRSTTCSCARHPRRRAWAFTA